jgi:hypothetical protein
MTTPPITSGRLRPGEATRVGSAADRSADLSELSIEDEDEGSAVLFGRASGSARCPIALCVAAGSGARLAGIGVPDRSPEP